MTPEQLELLMKGGMIGLLSLAVIGFIKGWVITSAHHLAVVSELNRQLTEALREKEEFKHMALRSVELGDRALKAAESIASDTTRHK